MDIIQQYFECVRDAGFDTNFEISLMQDDREVRRFQFDHCYYDGVSALAEIARAFPEVGFSAPSLTVKPAPSIGKRIWELSKWYIRFYPFLASKWKGLPTDSARDKTTSAFIEIKNWRQYYSSTNLNAALLKSLDETSKSHLLKPRMPRIWMAPVGLYEVIDRNISPANRVSFIDIKVKDSNTPVDLQQQIRKQLIELNYWGTFLTMYTLLFTGRKLYSIIARNLHHIFRRTGTFSNLGEWTIPGLAENQWMSFSKGVVAPFCPVEGTAIIVNGHLALSIHFDKSLGWSEEKAQHFIEQWKVHFLKFGDRKDEL